ncbi:helix-turn-helix domain-containing protein [Halalkalicoccus subterraneus]|uniref:helix-turn-helix domain-containing protein n=1 Tax=Halalkalicoccus subterraneus TaxID=2675002 RepID=UPI000EFC1B08|nr:bacterio-opsin activator domain-containing protein [Halalkalicoccus subterraneus]
MATILELRLPIEQFALARTFTTLADLRVEIERFAAQEEGALMPFVWVEAGDFEAFEEALADDPSVEEFELLTELDDERFYRMSWIDDVELAMHLLLEHDAAITTANTTGDAWTFQVMCPDHDAVSETYSFCEDNGLSLTVDAIYELGHDGESKYGLTESQHDSILTAKEMGYYDVPRSTSLTDLADELDISHQALSERLRRGHGRLIDRALGAAPMKRTEKPSEADR